MLNTGFENFILIKNDYLPFNLGTVGHRAHYQSTIKSLELLSRRINEMNPNDIVNLLNQDSLENRKDIFEGVLKFIDFTKHLDWLIRNEVLDAYDAHKKLFKEKGISKKKLQELKNFIKDLLQQSCNFISGLFNLENNSSKIFDDLNDLQKSPLRKNCEELKQLIHSVE